MIRKRTFFLLFLFFCSFLEAKSNQERLELSLSQAIDYAVTHNRSLANASLEIKKAKAKSWQVLGGMLPQVNASFDYQNFCGYKMSLMNFEIPMNPTGTLGITASMSLSGAQIVSAMLVDLAVDMADVSVKKNEQEISAQVIKVYVTILAMEKTVGLLDSNLVHLQKLHKITEDLVNAGVGEQTDADKLSVQVASMKNTINSNKRTLEMLYNSLKLQLGTEVNTSIVLTDELKNSLKIDEAKDLLNLNFDIERNYNYQLLQQNLILADKQVIMAKVNYLPHLSMFYKYSYKTYFGADKGMDMTPPNLVGLSLNIPIFSSGIKAKQVEEAQIAKEILDNTFANTKNALLVQNKQLRYNLTNAFEDYENQQANIDVSQRVFESISRKYEHGTASSLDVTNASMNLINAQAHYVQSMLNLVNAKIELEVLLNNKKLK